jgi:EAL domain-containing protein (putative c-di-GMP-specific phosphodiesterase class I)
VWFTNERAALPIAAAGTSAWNLRIGEPAPRSLARYLATRAAIGAWIERGDIVGIDVDRGAPDALLLADPAACAPLGKLGEPLGLLVLGAEPGASIADVDDTLAAAIDFASMATKLLHADLEARRRNQAERSGVAETLLSHAYVSCFQPIRSLDDDVIVGFEALTRFADSTPPAWRFAEAQRVGLGIELEEATILSALAGAVQLPARRWVSVNASPALVLGATGALTEALRTADRNIVVELTEHDPVEDYDLLRSALNRLGADVLLSVDDAGSGFASLRHVLILEPDFIKLDQSWVRGIDSDRARQALVAGLQSFAAKTDCRLIAEGIETEAERRTLVDLDVPLGQGFLLGVPAPPR